MKNNMLIVVLLVVIAVGGVWYVNSSKQTGTETPTGGTQDTSLKVPAPDNSGTPEMVVASEAKEVVVDASEFKFAPTSITVKKGEKVSLSKINGG